MSEEDVFPWIAVDNYMNDEFRETVVDLALNHLPDASPELRRYAKQAFNRSIRIDGFRTASRASAPILHPHAVRGMQDDLDIATAVIILWAEAKEELINDLWAAAEETDLRFIPGWSVTMAQEGFHGYDEVRQLNECAEELIATHPDEDADHLRLAVLWLSRALVAEDTEVDETTLDLPKLVGASKPLSVTRETDEETEIESGQPDPDAARDMDETGSETREPEATEVQAQDSLPPVEVPADEQDSIEMSQSLVELESIIHEQLGELDQASQTVIVQARAIGEAAEASLLPQTEKLLTALQSTVSSWQCDSNSLLVLLQRVASRIKFEFEGRPDLDRQEIVAELAEGMIPAGTRPEEAVENVLLALERIRSYDRDRQAALRELDQVRARVVELQEYILGWVSDEPLGSTESASAYPSDSEDPVTLDEVRRTLEKAAAELHSLESRRSQLRELSMARIVALINRLQSFDLPPETQLEAELTLETTTDDAIKRLTDQQLKRVENSLNRLLEEQISQARSASPAALAAELQQEWDDAQLVDLLKCLADESRDVETLLAVLGSSKAHPRSQPLSLERPVTQSLLRGIGELSPEAQPFALVNWLASDLLTGWAAADRLSQAELCLVCLAARGGAEHPLPEGFLWNLPVEWPIPEMENWGQLWQDAIMGNPPQIVNETQDDRCAQRLAQARADAAQNMTREHGIFVRLSSLRSRRHQAMLSDLIMPELQSKYELVSKIEDHLSTSDSQDSGKLLKLLEQMLPGKEFKKLAKLHAASYGQNEPDKIMQLLDELFGHEFVQLLSEKKVTDSYESGIHESRIADKNAFYRRSALRVLQVCAESIIEYAEASLDYWRDRFHRPDGVTREVLQTELELLPDSTPLGLAALEQICQPKPDETSAREEAQVQALAAKQVVRELLRKTVHILSMPRVVGHLSGNRLEWSQLVAPLLSDLAEPVDTAGAAVRLLEHGAPNQVLLLTQYIPLDIQKSAQALKQDKGHQVDALYDSLLKIGGDAEDLMEDRDLGRWKLVQQELEQHLARQRSAAQVEQTQIHEQADQLRRRINDLDQAVFEARATIPVDVLQLVESGLSCARGTVGSAELGGPITDYLQEVQYRLKHDSWPLAEVQNAVYRLEGAADEKAASAEKGVGIEDVLDLLERKELRQLNLSPSYVTHSEIETRCALLQNWMQVRQMRGFLGEELKVAERDTIQRLFSSFARMTAMQRGRAPDGKPIEYEFPIVFSHWDLRYPKTAALDKRCILVALPGNPPSPSHLTQLDHIFEDRQWLVYEFVLLFVPGCTPGIRLRLESSYRGRGLVILDEATMQDMVLAESVGSNPVGRLRPIMLNSSRAQNVDVFIVNERVNTRTAIFVGRQALIDRVASGGGSYALYGGRRIGKSSVLSAVEERLKSRGATVVTHSFEGERDCSDDATAVRLTHLLNIQEGAQDSSDFKSVLQAFLDENPEARLVFLLDEIDRYIQSNPTRHILIETLRSLADQYGRVRAVVAGFMDLYDCLQGRGPYTPTSDPWGRMLNDYGPLGNLRPVSAERIVREGCVEILGWHFENRAIPQRIVERTGGHPAFVQGFCKILQQRVGRRGDRKITLNDVQAVFDDQDPDQSFVSWVEKVLRMNLDPFSRYLILWLAAVSSDAQGFTLDEMRALATDACRTPVPDHRLERALERLTVTSVIRETAPQVYEFSVPDYPSILNRLGRTADLKELEDEMEHHLSEDASGNH